MLSPSFSWPRPKTAGGFPSCVQTCGGSGCAAGMLGSPLPPTAPLPLLATLTLFCSDTPWPIPGAFMGLLSGVDMTWGCMLTSFCSSDTPLAVGTWSLGNGQPGGPDMGGIPGMCGPGAPKIPNGHTSLKIFDHQSKKKSFSLFS